MYCPNCGSNNQADIKFCTRCGANLALVSDVTSGKLTGGSGIDERLVKLLKDCYSGRRATILGAGFLIVGLLIMSPLITTKKADDIRLVALFALGCLIYGAICLVWGIGHWMDSSSEMKALDVALPPHSLPTASSERLNTSRIPSLPALVERYSTDPIEPGSVTEQTTRQLEHSHEHLENQSPQKQ